MIKNDIFILHPSSLNHIPILTLSLSIIRIFFFRKKLLIILITLEFVLLRIFLILIILLTLYFQPPSLAFFILVLGACEARLGLRILIILVRFKGRDILRKVTSFKC